jgi:PDZ domain-containing protein
MPTEPETHGPEAIPDAGRAEASTLTNGDAPQATDTSTPASGNGVDPTDASASDADAATTSTDTSVPDAPAADVPVDAPAPLDSPVVPDTPEGTATPEAPEPGPSGTGPFTPFPPVPTDEPSARPRRSRGRIAAAIAVCLLAAFIIGATVVPLPYYLFKPGSVRDTEPLITVSGADTFPSDGSIGYTTVSLRQATLLGLAQGWIDDDIDVYGKDRVLQGRNVNDNRQLNLLMMDNSKQVATQVALQKLGYDVHVTIGEVVTRILPDTPADGVLKVNDVLVAVDGERFDDADDLTRVLGAKAPGDTVTVTTRDTDGNERDVPITLAPSPDDPNRGIMGVTLQAVVLDYDFPVDVAIDTGDVGGPSAGLAFTLAIIDDLTPGELTGGGDVAVTGTISADGTVGPVGGTGQKAAAVRREGIKLFLVPRQDYADAVAHAGKSLKVVPVDTVDEALAVLADHGGNGLNLPQVGAAQPPAAA